MNIRPYGIISSFLGFILVWISLTPTVFGFQEDGSLQQMGTDESPAIDKTDCESHPVPTGIARGDWTSIRAAHQAFRHRAIKTRDGFRAVNPGQGWGLEFDARGFLVRPKSGDWSWGLQLQSYGFEKYQNLVKRSYSTSALKNQVTHQWSDFLEEWYINDDRGLEHGYTLAHRPKKVGDGNEALEFNLAIQGSLIAEVSSDGTGVKFINDEGQVVLTYAGLRVFDKNNTNQPAVFSGGGQQIRISIRERNACYPLTIDPVAQEAYLKASNSDPMDNFGIAVAVSGDRVIVGAIGDDSSASGVNGNGNINDATDVGAAYVFRKVGGVWIQEAYLKASNVSSRDKFGNAVAISGDLVVVGSPLESSIATGVNGNGADNTGHDSGAAYVFREVGGVWTQEAYLKASNTDRNDQFGTSVAVSVSGNRVVVGSPREDSSATGVNGIGALDDAADAGAAYVFRKAGGVWSQEAYLKASTTDTWDSFGHSVAVSGDRVVIGAQNEDSSAAGVNGDQSLNDALSSGAVYVFRVTGGVWAQEAYLKASNTGSDDAFGYSVALSGNQIVVGAPFEDSAAAGVNGDGSDNIAQNSGAAYVFREVGGVWIEEAYIKASNRDLDDQFGWSVASSGNRVVIGARREDSSAAGVNGDGSNNLSPTSGAAYVFRIVGGVWMEEAFLKASNSGQSDSFGFSVGVSGRQVVVGALQEDGSARGVNGDETLDDAADSGAAYVFDMDEHASVYCSPAVPNSTGFPGTISVTGSTIVSENSLTVHADGLPVGVFAYFLTSKGRDFIAMPGGSNGNLCLGGGQTIGRIYASLQMSDGSIRHLLDLNSLPTSLGTVQGIPGEIRNFQGWYRDGTGMSNFTSAIAVPFE